MKKIIILGISLLFLQGVEAKDHPYDLKFGNVLEAKFFEGNEISSAKLEIHKARIQQKILEISALIGDNKKADKSDSIAALKLALSFLDKMKSSDRSEALRLGSTFLELEDAVKIEGDSGSIVLIAEQMRNVLRRWTIPFHSISSDEATDLYDPQTKSFLSTDDLKGKDLSSYDPDPKSVFWRDPRKASFYDGINMYFPEVPVVQFDEMKYSDTKPKMNVFVSGPDGKKYKYKLKFGAEIHADPTLGSIVAKLGFGTDRSKYVTNIRVNLGKKYKLKELIRDWETYYRRDNAMLYLIERYILKSGSDENGEYVIFKEGLLEAKPSEIHRVGGWSFSEQSHPSLRSLRALTLVQMWMDNTDIKEYGNNRVLVRGNETLNIISDLGKSLGGLVGEKPELYNSRMITGRSSEGLTISFRALHSLGIKNKITFADARWTGRLIAGLSRKDFEEASMAGGWPLCIQKLYIGKLISRRNDLIKNLSLIGERDRNGNIISEIPVTEDMSFNHACTRSDLSESTINFDFSYRGYFAPAMRTMRNQILDLGTNAFGQTRRVTLSGAELKLEKGLISQVIFQVRRDVEQNPSPKGPEDLYIVKDHFEVGLRLGISFGIYHDYIYTRAYSLAYPARSKAEARFKNGYLLNFFLPDDVEAGKLPEKYVLHTDHFFEKGVGVEIDDLSSAVSPGIKARTSFARIFRTILDHRKKDRIIVYRDRTDYAEVFLRAFARVTVFKFPIMATFARWGKASGAGTVLTQEEAEKIDLNKAVVEGDFSELVSHEREFALRNHFREQELHWNLVFFQGRNSGRFERIHLEVDGNAEDLIQYRTSHNRSWNFFGNAEKRTTSIEVVAGKNSTDYQLKVTNVCLDSGVSDKELENEYLKFINYLSPDQTPIIPFSPHLGYTTNGVWGKLEARSETTFYKEAITKILSLEEENYWPALAAHLNVSKTKLDDVIKKVLEAQDEINSSSVAGSSAILKSYGINQFDYNLILRSHDFLRNLKALRKINDTGKKLKKLGTLFRKISTDSKDSRILGTLIRLSGEGNYFTANVISPPRFAEMNTIEGIPMVGQRGRARPDENNYLNYVPQTALELYHVFDSWRLNP